MIERVFKGSIALAVLTVWAGIIARAVTGSNKAFEIAPVISASRGVVSWLNKSAIDSTKQEPNPKPFAIEAEASVKRVRKTVSKTLQDIPAGQTDPRLAVCPAGSVESAAIREIPYSVVIALKQALARGAKFTDLIEVQKALKAQPVCNFVDGRIRQYRYLVQGFRIIDARQRRDNSQVELRFTNF